MLESIFFEGLVDSKTESEFDDLLIALEKEWQDIEVAHSCPSTFYEWFVSHKASTMKVSMIRKVREEACLGDPPVPFTTNASEAINSVIKARVLHKKDQLMDFIVKLKELIDEKEVEQAVIG